MKSPKENPRLNEKWSMMTRFGSWSLILKHNCWWGRRRRRRRKRQQQTDRMYKDSCIYKVMTMRFLSCHFLSCFPSLARPQTESSQSLDHTFGTGLHWRCTNWWVCNTSFIRFCPKELTTVRQHVPTIAPLLFSHLPFNKNRSRKRRGPWSFFDKSSGLSIVGMENKWYGVGSLRFLCGSQGAYPKKPIKWTSIGSRTETGRLLPDGPAIVIVA